LRELIQDYRIGEHGRVYLVDGKGKVQIHPSDTNIQPLRAYVGADLAEQLQGQEFSYGFHQRNGSELISASLPVPGIGWQIVAEIPTDELYADIRVATIQNIVLGIVAAIIALVVVTLLSGRILQPIRRVSSAMAAMAEQGGDLTQRLEIATNDEIGELASSFTQFLENLAGIIKHIQWTEEQIQQIDGRVVTTKESTAQRPTQQSEQYEMAATANYEMTATMAEIAQKSETAAVNAARSRDESSKGMATSQG